MKTCFLLFCVGFARLALAGTYQVPKDEPILSVKVPEKWKVKEHEEFIEGTAPEEAMHLLVLPVEHNKAAESLGEGVRYIRNTGRLILKAETVKRESATINGRKVQSVSWDGKDPKGEIKLRCHIVSGKDDKQAIIFFWGSSEAEKKHQKDLNQILETLKNP